MDDYRAITGSAFRSCQGSGLRGQGRNLFWAIFNSRFWGSCFWGSWFSDFADGGGSLRNQAVLSIQVIPYQQYFFPSYLNLKHNEGGCVI